MPLALLVILVMMLVPLVAHAADPITPVVAAGTDYGALLALATKWLQTNPEGAVTAVATAALPLIGQALKRPELGELMKRVPVNRRWMLSAGVALVLAYCVAVQYGLAPVAVLWKALGLLTSGVGLYKIWYEDIKGRETGLPTPPILPPAQRPFAPLDVTDPPTTPNPPVVHPGDEGPPAPPQAPTV